MTERERICSLWEQIISSKAAPEIDHSDLPWRCTCTIKNHFFPEQEIEQVAKEYLGKEIYVCWPHLYEAKVISVSDDAER